MSCKVKLFLLYTRSFSAESNYVIKTTQTTEKVSITKLNLPFLGVGDRSEAGAGTTKADNRVNHNIAYHFILWNKMKT